ncbi:MAG: PKD domain-containing protein, partial [Tenuifilaceae bacterium]|nr:PKD domain-containing protein [Tenuifilaceae bacterium]
MNHKLPLANYIPGYIRRSALGALLFVLFSFGSFAQTDTEFWFVVPEVTISHQSPGGVPASFRISSGAFPTIVTISMPANEFHPTLNPGGFQDIVINMPANSFFIQDMSCWVVTPCNTAVGAAVVDFNPPLLENKPINISGVNDLGIQITSNNPITVYYEISRNNNKDIWALKGNNALGREFFVPFQNQMGNWTGGTVKAYSAIDVVATEDNTSVTFYLPAGKQAAYGSPFQPIAAGGTHTVILNRGQTFSLFPRIAGGIISQAAVDRIGGVRIVSTKRIAVTTKDDSYFHTTGGCYDIAGDQMIPIQVFDKDLSIYKGLIGMEYAVMRTDLTTNDHIFMLATENATTITVRNMAGVVVATNTINAQEQWYRALPSPQTHYHITSDKPIYVWHVGGFGCEQGGAILPPIDKCTGSTQVSFARTSTETFYMVIMVRKGAENSFRFMVQDTPGNFVDKSHLITGFTAIPGSDWSVVRIGSFSATTGANRVPATNHYIENTHPDDGIFHLGIVNGGSSSGCFYGYFSNFNELKASGVVAGTGSQFLYSCFGETVQLSATGGTRYKWYQNNFEPAVTLSDDEAQNPFANPTTNTNYKVVVSGFCNMKDTAEINVQVSDEIIANFTTDIVAGCAPLDVTFTDNSTGVDRWQYDMGDGSAYYLWDTNLGNPNPPDPPSPFEFTHTFNNTTNAPIEYTITLLAKKTDGCNDIFTKRIVVYPEINASYTQANVSANPLCATPLEVSFTNTSSSNTDDNYYWDFGDGFNRVSDVHNETFTYSFTNTELTPKTFDIEMVAVSPFACRDTAISQVTVTSFYEPIFTLDKTNGCGPLTVNVTNTSSGDIVAYSWNLSPAVAGTPIDDSDFSLNLTNNGDVPIIYELSLTVTNSDGCSKTSPVQQITVYPYVSTGFNAPAQVCNNTSVNFTDITSPITVPVSTYSWDFGDGAGSSLVNPSHTYNNLQVDAFGYVSHTYNVTLTVTNPWGCSNSFSRNIEVGALNEPDFVLFPAEGCSPLEVSFQNTSLGHPVFTRLWEFSDGSPSSTAITPANRTFINNGTAPLTVTVRYTATNGMGCSDFVERDVVVYPKVNVGFTASDVAICDSVQVDFAGSVTPALSNVSYSWSFGDGATGMGSDTSHVFRNFTDTDQTYTTTLVARSEYNCFDIDNTSITVSPNIKALFSASRAEICSGEDITFTYHRMGSIQNYSFVFDGYTDNAWPGDATALGNFTKTFTNTTGAPMPITVRLTVSNGTGGCDKIYEIPIVVNPEVTPGFTWSDNGNALGCEPLDVTFTNTTTYTGGGAFAGTYSWDFGDGASSAEASPNHTFSNNSPSSTATYTVTLTVTSEHGCVATAPTQDITVQPRLTAGFTFDQSSNCTPFDVTFNPSSSVGATQYHWSFDGAIPDETLATNASFTRTFTNVDPSTTESYDITLTVENAAGCTDVLTRTIEVYPEVVADFVNSAATPLDGCADHTVTFENLSTGGSLTFIWDFGDGATYTTPDVTEDVTHTFVNNGTVDIPYTVRLTAINPNGCSTFMELTVTVHPKVEANFSIASVASCVSTTSPFVLDVSAPAIANISYSWTFNGETRTGTNPVFSPITENKTGANEYYNIVLTATGTGLGSCTDINNTQTVTIYPEVQAQWSGDLTAKCTPASLNLTNTSDLYLAANPVASIHWEAFDETSTLVASSDDQVFTPNLINNSHTAQKNYSVRITATSNDGCVGVHESPFTVNPEPLARFNVDFTQLCTPVEIEVTDESVTIADADYTWNWYGGAEVNTSGQNYTVTYQNDTEVDDFKHISLTLLNQYNCTSSYDYLFTVTPKVNAIISGASVDQICGSEIITFSNASTGGIHRYNWDFGDGNKMEIDSKADVSHTFANNGLIPLDRTVTLTATNSIGCTNDALATYNVVVYPRVAAAQSFTLGDICGGQVELNLNNASTNKDVVSLDAANTFEWQFTTADAGGASQVFTPADVNPVLGNTDRINPVTYNLNFLAQSVWNYNGNPTHTCVDNVAGEDVVVYPNLVPVYESPLAACSGQTGVLLTFAKDNANSSGGGVGDVTLDWNFGDGNTQSSNFDDISHTFLNLSNTPFTTPTHYVATQLATGCTYEDDIAVTVYPRVSAAQSFTLGDLCGGEVDITLVNASSNTAVTTATNNYEWRFTPD